MDLPNIFSKLTAKQKLQEQFLAIEIGSETVTTAVWQIVNGQMQIVNIGTTQDWEMKKDSIEALLTAIDTSLEKSLSELDPEPNKIIFGLQESWVEGKTISKKYAKILKQITEKFEFEPVGFVVTTEAIVHLLKQQEGIPPTAILILVNESEIQVSLVNLGKIIGSQTVSRSEDIGADVEEGLARFKIEDKLPSRMLLLNSTFDLETLEQNLLSYDWTGKLPFLHFPKVEILEKQITIKAVAIAGGAEAAKALGFEIIEEKEEEKEEEEKAAAEKEETQAPHRPDQEELEAIQPETIPSADIIGFKTDADVAKDVSEEEKIKEETPQLKKPKPLEEEKQVQEEEAEQPSVIRGTWGAKLKAIVSQIPGMPHLPRPKIPQLGITFGSRAKTAAVLVVVFFILIAAAAIYALWTIPKARLVLYVRPKKLEKELTIIIDSLSSQIIAAENLIPGETVELEVDGEKEKETTGTKLIGEKAKGEVTIYNKTSAAKTFPAGTTVIGPNSLAFSLDASVTVASASSEEADESVTMTFGKTKVSVTADAIGAEYNLSSNTDFKFKSFSAASYDAKNEPGFTGGSSREVQAITQEDIDSLLDDLKQDLKQKAASELENQEGPGKKVLVDGVITEVILSEVSGEAGDEAEKVRAKLMVKITTLAYNEEDYQEILRQSTSEAIPADFKLKEDESIAEVRDTEFQDGVARIRVLYKALLIPRIQEEEIKRDLKGKYLKLVEEYLESLPNFSRAEIEISPKALPARLKTFPRKADNITIEVKVEQSE